VLLRESLRLPPRREIGLAIPGALEENLARFGSALGRRFMPKNSYTARVN
jgi:hypothetical protein